MTENNENPDIPPEDTMSEPDIEDFDNQDDEAPVIDLSSATDMLGEAERSLVQLVILDGEDNIHEPTCGVCSSAYRSEIEGMVIQKNSKKEIQDFIKSSTTSSITDNIITNHMRFHYENGIRQRQVVEYIDKLRRLSCQEITTLGRIKTQLNALTERLVGVNSLVPTGNSDIVEIEKIKSQETSRISKTVLSLLQLQANLMGEMKSSGELITLPKAAFVQLFNDAKRNATSDTEKDTIKNILDKLAELARL